MHDQRPKEITLYDACQGDYELTIDDITDLTQVLGNYCRAKTKALIRGRLESITLQPCYSRYKQVVKYKDKWMFYAAQAWPEELVEARKHLLGKQP